MGGDTQRAGFFMPRRIAPKTYDGKITWTVFADLLQVPDDVFQLMRRCELPYRSVEVFEWDTPEINSLALLEDEVPFFRYEILRIAGAEEDVAVASLFRASEPSAPAREGYSVGTAGKRLFLFKEVHMPDDPVDGDRTEDTDLGDRMTKLEAALAELVKLVTKPSEATDATPAEDVMSGTPEKKVDLTAAEDVASLSGRVVALETLQAQSAKQAETSKLAIQAEAELAEWPLDAETKAKIHTFAEQGPTVLQAFVESIKRAVPKDPPPTLDDAENPTRVIDSPEVMSFAAEGADSLAKARAASRTHAELMSRCPSFGTTLKEFISQAVHPTSLPGHGRVQ